MTGRTDHQGQMVRMDPQDNKDHVENRGHLEPWESLDHQEP